MRSGLRLTTPPRGGAESSSGWLEFRLAGKSGSRYPGLPELGLPELGLEPAKAAPIPIFFVKNGHFGQVSAGDGQKN